MGLLLAEASWWPLFVHPPLLGVNAGAAFAAMGVGTGVQGGDR